VTSAVLDTVILVRGLLDPFSWSGQILFQHGKRFTFVVSKEVVEEYLDVLHRPKVMSKFRETADRDIEAVFKLIRSAKSVEIHENPSISRDLNDDKFIATALASDAEYVVTQDKDLLVLREYEGISFVTSEEFLRRIRNR
jgi:uncharacterized protein